jgi:hypothetical protein
MLRVFDVRASCDAAFVSPQMLEKLLAVAHVPLIPQAGCVKLHSFVQYPVLIRSLSFCVLDLFLARALPEVKVHGLKNLRRTMLPTHL